MRSQRTYRIMLTSLTILAAVVLGIVTRFMIVTQSIVETNAKPQRLEPNNLSTTVFLFGDERNAMCFTDGLITLVDTFNACSSVQTIRLPISGIHPNASMSPNGKRVVAASILLEPHPRLQLVLVDLQSEIVKSTEIAVLDNSIVDESTWLSIDWANESICILTAHGSTSNDRPSISTDHFVVRVPEFKLTQQFSLSKRGDLVIPSPCGRFVAVCNSVSRSITEDGTAITSFVGYPDRIAIVTLLDGSVRSQLMVQPRLDGTEPLFFDCKWSPDGRRLATIDSDNNLALWTSEGDFVGQTQIGRGNLIDVAFIANGLMIAGATDSGTIGIVDSKTLNGIKKCELGEAISSISELSKDAVVAVTALGNVFEVSLSTMKGVKYSASLRGDPYVAVTGRAPSDREVVYGIRFSGAIDLIERNGNGLKVRVQSTCLKTKDEQSMFLRSRRVRFASGMLPGTR